MLVQLGYQGTGQALLFVPRWVDGSFTLPERGNAVDAEVVAKLQRLEVPDKRAQAVSAAHERGEILH